MFPTSLPDLRADRWRLLEGAVGRWFLVPPVAAWGVDMAQLDAAQRRLGLRLPPAVREWFERFGALADVWSLQDQLLAPDEFFVKNDVLALCVENQGVVEWGVRVSDLALDDPPVVVSDPSGAKGWLVEADTTSRFALMSAATNAKWSDGVGFRANGQLTDVALAAIRCRYERLPFGDQTWPTFPSRLYGGDDLVVETHGDTWLWVASLSQANLAEVDALVVRAGMEWELIEDGAVG